MYAPTGSEIDITPIARHAWSLGKKVAFPRCNISDRTMDFKYVDSLDALCIGEYSILEPPASAESVKDFSRSICIVPGLLFDREGFRVGYGKGYYDRFLSNYNETRLGLVYSDFILDYVPRGRFDRSVDTLVCEKGVSIAETPKSK
jgi:5-formyltetrahydrofolate cyclo-ligase